MRNTLAAVVLVAMIGPGVVLADEVTVKGMPAYTGAVITSVEKGFIHFRLAAGNVLVRPIGDVERVQIVGIEAFNTAEKAMSAKEPNYAAAATAYDGITDLESRAWLKRLVQYRKLKALDQSGQFLRATQEWVNLLKEEKDAAAAFVPAQVGKKGSPDNPKAISLLDGQRQAAQAGTPAYQALAKVLMQVYQAEGMTDKADSLAAELAGGAARTTARDDKKGPGDGPGTSGTGVAARATADGAEAELAAKIQSAVILVREGQTPEMLTKALKTLQDVLKRCNESDLPLVLLVMGKAQILLAEKAAAGSRKELYVAGGLNCMRVIAHFPDAQEAAEALLLAGKANSAIGNQKAARAAFEMVQSRFKGTDAAKEASKLLERTSGK